MHRKLLLNRNTIGLVRGAKRPKGKEGKAEPERAYFPRPRAKIFAECRIWDVFCIQARWGSYFDVSSKRGAARLMENRENGVGLNFGSAFSNLLFHRDLSIQERSYENHTVALSCAKLLSTIFIANISHAKRWSIRRSRWAQWREKILRWRRQMKWKSRRRRERRAS